MSDADLKNDEYWRDKLSPEAFAVCRQKGTERPFSGVYNKHSEPGHYLCRCCAEVLFSSESKFDSGCGWPSFWAGLGKDKILEQLDTSHGMHRTEILCRRCHSHLGHVFTDGPAPTGLRYCVNSLSLNFEGEASQS